MRNLLQTSLLAIVVSLAIISICSCTFTKPVKEVQWWEPLAQKLNITLNDYMIYEGSIELEHTFINGTLVYDHDSIKLFKNGIAFGKFKDRYEVVRDQYQVFYFYKFSFAPNNYEIVFDKYEFYNIETLELLESKKEEGKYYTVWADRLKEVTYMSSRSYFETIE